MSNQISPGGDFRTTEELARSLGLSRWTVSRALNGHAGVSAATRKRIERAVRARGFQPSLFASALRVGRAPILGATIPHLEAYRLGTKLGILQEEVPGLGLRLVVEMSGGDPGREAEALRNLAALRPAGLIQFASTLAPDHPARAVFRRGGIPVVQVDPLGEGHPAVVVSDRARAIELALGHLHEHGCRLILLFGFSRDTAYGRARWTGIRRGLRRYRWRLGRDLENYSLGSQATDAAADGERYVALAAGRLGLRRSVPVGIVALNDWIALGAMRALMRRGFRLGLEVKVIGYDNAEFSAYTQPSLSSVDPCSGELIRAAIDLLQASRQGAVMEQSPVGVAPRLVARETTLGSRKECSA